MKCWKGTWLHWKRRYDNEDSFCLNVGLLYLYVRWARQLAFGEDKKVEILWGSRKEASVYT